MYELVLLVHVYLYLDNRLSLDMIGMFHIILLWFYPYVIPSIRLFINRWFLFLGFGLCVCVGCPAF